jgi:hypothetical protein
MAGRLVALGLLAVCIAIAAIFVAVPFLNGARDRLPAEPGPGEVLVSPGPDGLAFAGQTGEWRLDGRLALDPTRSLQVAFTLADGDGRPAPASIEPRVTLDMVDHAMDEVAPTVRRSAPGAFTATAWLPMAGRWRLSIALPDDSIAFVVDVPA